MNTCESCKHWTPMLGRERDDPASTWGACSQLLSISVGTTGQWIALRASPYDNENAPHPTTARVFGCNGWEAQ